MIPDRSGLFWGGHLLSPRAFAASGRSALPPDRLVDGSGLSGAEGLFHLHGNDHATMWMTVDRPGEENWVAFDFGQVEPLGAMAVWNFNQGSGLLSAPGFRDFVIETSLDSEVWTELRGSGHPYRLARSKGSGSEGPAGLVGAEGLPIDLGGAAARWLRLRPDPRCGKGNWGEYMEGQVRFGLAAIRFTRHRPRVERGSVLPFTAHSPDSFTGLDVFAAGLGLSDPWSPQAGCSTHSADPKTMALSRPGSRYGILEFEFDGVYPLDRLWLWNYNESGETAAGIRSAWISTSIDGDNWEDIGGGHAFTLARADGREGIPATGLDEGGKGSVPILLGGRRARSVRLTLSGGLHHGGVFGAYDHTQARYGLAKAVFTAAEGLVAESRRDWTALFSNHDGWTGADGIFSFAAPRQEEGVNECASLSESRRSSFFIFSDTMTGTVDSATQVRRDNLMVNNSLATLGESDPARASPRFILGAAQDGCRASILKPHADSDYHWWFQDGTITNDGLHLLSLNVRHDPELPPDGFQFRVKGIDLVTVPLSEGVPDGGKAVSRKTALYDESLGMSFGCAILENTEQAGTPMPDGFVYIYGLVRKGSLGQLCAARVLPGDFAELAAWRFFDGATWVEDPKLAHPLLPAGACECSVTPWATGPWAGRYVYIGIPMTIGRQVEAWLGDTPVGPFRGPELLYPILEPDEFSRRGVRRVYTYNAKAHPDLSESGSLLVSHNVNSMDYSMHFLHADIYRPRFTELRFL